MNDGKEQQPNKMTLRFLARKLREKGIVCCFKAAVCMVFWRLSSFLKPQKIFLINLLRFLASRKPMKVILGVWDYKTVPWSVGDFLVFIETLSVLKLERNADRVDICVICDRENPAGNRGYKNINPSNFRYHLFSLLPIINTSPYLGSVFQFESRAEFDSFIKQNLNNYEIYPPINQQLKEAFNFYGGATFKEIQDFYRKHAFIPHLAINDYHLRWACNFYKTNAEGLLPVVVSLRNRPSSAPRNADHEAWLAFFDLCKSEFPEIVFVVVGVREEAFEELRQRSNVLIAKDYGSTLADDFALIRTSLLYMGVESGIAAIAFFSDVPYLVFGRPPETGKQQGLKPGATWEFATPYQKVFYTSLAITPQSLLEEFSVLYNRLDIDKWREKASTDEATLLSFANLV